MARNDSALWGSLERLGPAGFVLAGLGSVSVVAISGLEILLYGQRFQVVPEIGIALVAIPTMFATLVGLLGFYPRIAGHSRWLARGGGATAAVGLLGVVLATVAGIVADLLGIARFTGGEDVAVLNFLFFLVIVTLLLSFLLYGVASVLTSRPSRLVGFLLLIPVVEPLSVIAFGLLGVEVPGGPLITLGIQGVALLALGYFLYAAPEPTGSAEPATDTTVR